MKFFFFEITDTFGGEANYCWVRRYKIAAHSIRGALRKLARNYGAGWHDVGAGRWDLRNACICAFGEEWDESAHSQYLHVSEI